MNSEDAPQVNIDRRQRQFVARTTPLVFLAIAVAAILCGVVNILVGGSWLSWGGTLVFCLFTIAILTIRNFSYVLQQTPRNFTDSSKHVSLVWYLLVINVLVIVIAFVMPEDIVKSFTGTDAANAGFFFILFFLIAGLVINALNLYAPVWLRQREIFQEEGAFLGTEKRELEEQFEELDQDQLRTLTKRKQETQNEADHENVMLNILAERMVDTQKLLKFTIQNQRILLTRQDSSANKMVMTVLFFSLNLISLLAFSLRAFLIYAS